ncbi:MAG: class I SAM-dependent methyltransferase [Deltaproteobacteria bacterium]|nr:class I SAM-dependent methyltransferase [Deltaproteobacteria bacterium]
MPYYDLFHDETIGLIKVTLPEVKIWLDTGCGRGQLVNKAAGQFPDTRFLLADPSSEMLSLTKKRLCGFPPDRVRFIGAFGSANLSGKVLDKPQVITAIQCHHYMDAEQRKKATVACFEILEQGGMYITFENVRPVTRDGREIGLDRWGSFQLSQGLNKEVCRRRRKRFDKAYFPITVTEHLYLLADCGFRSAELFWLSHMQAGFYAIK